MPTMFSPKSGGDKELQAGPSCMENRFKASKTLKVNNNEWDCGSCGGSFNEDVTKKNGAS
jgi:hypothetical protein